MGKEDFTAIPGGLPGVETRGELMYTYGVTTRLISLAAMCKVLSENPARLYGLYPRKGTLSVGSDADIVVYDPQGESTLHGPDLLSSAGYTPFEGFEITGNIDQVWLRGKLAAKNGGVTSECNGQFIPRGKNML